jgi:hypothetical protein
MFDALSRLSRAEGWTKNSGGTTVNTWGQDFGYDGFGNLLSQAPKSGYPDASPNVLLTVNAANNRISCNRPANPSLAVVGGAKLT